jgi:hypothetical protein
MLPERLRRIQALQLIGRAFLSWRSAIPTNPTISKLALMTMSQCGYCIVLKSSANSSPSTLAANPVRRLRPPGHKQSAAIKAHRDPAVVAALDNVAFFPCSGFSALQARVSGISLTRSPTLSPALDLAFCFISLRLELRFAQVQEKLVDIFLGVPPSKQSDGRCPDHDLILAKLALQLKAVASPPRDVQRFGHDFEYDDLVVHRPAVFLGGALGGGASKCSQSAETLRQALSDFGVFFGLERLAVIVMEGQKNLDHMHRGPLPSEPQHSEHEKQRHRDRRRE